MAVSTTGLAVVAVMPCPTLYILGVRVKDQVGGSLDGVGILLAGPRLHVADVPGRAAVLSIFTAHSMG